LNLSYKALKDGLSKSLQEKLPAHSAHQKIMKNRPTIEELGKQMLGAKQSAVLCLMYQDEGEWKIVYIKRPKYEGVHSAQIGFPGGKREDSDRDYFETALREANEELNIQNDDVSILGKLSPLYVPPSNFLIQPIVGLQAHRPDFILEEREVSGIIEMPLTHLLSERHLKTRPVSSSLYSIKTKGFEYKNEFIWGATAMISMEFVQLIKRIQ